MGRIPDKLKKYVSLPLLLLIVVGLGGHSFSPIASSNDWTTLETSSESIGLSLEGFAGPPGPMPVNYGEVRTVAVPIPGRTSATLLKENMGSKDPGNVGPLGTPAPSPADAPFGPDIPVFDNPYNQKNPSIDRDSNDYVYTAFEHYEAGDSDIYVAKSGDGGITWDSLPVANSANDESSPSLEVDYSPTFQSDLWYLFYEVDELEFAWSSDGEHWSIEDFGGGITFWRFISRPYVTVKDDFIVVVAEMYDQGQDRDTWCILYSLDSFFTVVFYYFNMWGDVSVYRPRVTIIDSDEILVTMDVFDDSDPANPDHDAYLVHATLNGEVVSDSWDTFYSVSFQKNEDYTNPVVEANGREVIFTMELFTPHAGPLPTRILYCMWTDSYQGGSTLWYRCLNTAGYLAFHDTKNQKYASLHRDGTAVHLAWLNGTDMNYRYSPDGGASWIGEPGTGLPLKVNEPGAGTALDAWHSPDITLVAGDPGVVWHDTRENGSIYFNTIQDKVRYRIEAEPRYSDILVREATDPSWHSSPYGYLWKIGTNHTVEALASYQIPGGPLLNFCHWSDGNTSSPHNITVTASPPNITAVYCCENSTLIVDTSPPDLLVFVNDTQYTSPVVFCCNDSDIFKVSAPSSQPAGPGATYNFSHWSDGEAQEHNLSVTGFVKVVAYFDLIKNEPPVADAGGPYFGRKNFPVNFNGSGSYDPDGTIVSYEWDFGDASAHGFGGSIFHSYAAGGTFTVELNVTDNNGSWNSDTTTATISDLPPGAPTVLDAVLTGLLLQDVELAWSLSEDDGGVENDVDAYVIYYGISYEPDGVGYALLDAVSTGSTSYVHAGGGFGDPDNYFYRVCAVDDNAQETCASQQASKFTRYLNTGMQLLSIPLVLSDTTTSSVFQTVSFDRVIFYDAMASDGRNWRSFDTRKAYSDLRNVNRTMALWVDVAVDSQFTIAGLVPSQTLIHLAVGWNFIGFPSFGSSYMVADLKADTGAFRVEGYDPLSSPYHLRILGNFETLKAGYGYWILTDSETTWIVDSS